MVFQLVLENMEKLESRKSREHKLIILIMDIYLIKDVIESNFHNSENKYLLSSNLHNSENYIWIIMMDPTEWQLL